jgi:ribonuclease P protein component
MDETNFPAKQQATQENARIPRAHEHAGRTAGAEEAAGKGTQASHGGHSTETAQVTDATAVGRRSQRFPRALRLRKRREFLAVQRKGRRQTAPHFVVITRRRKDLPSRLGITTSRRVGTAPERNRVRRLVREFFRRQVPPTSPRDIVVIARPGAARLSYGEVTEQLSRVMPCGEKC